MSTPHPPSFRGVSGARGFTLIELMVTLTVLGVLLGVGIPSFRDFIAGQRVKSASFELMSSMMIARSEAVKRNATVSVTPVSSAAWASGWSVMFSGTKLHDQQPVDGITVATFSDYASCATAATVATVDFSSSGRPSAGSCFKFSGSTSATRCVKVDLSGIPSSGNCP
jgi:type IV fimbrial biogenesis protein FimT